MYLKRCVFFCFVLHSRQAHGVQFNGFGDSSDLAFLFHREGVDSDFRAKLEEHGVASVAKFGALVDTQSELRELLSTEFGMTSTGGLAMKARSPRWLAGARSRGSVLWGGSQLGPASVSSNCSHNSLPPCVGILLSMAIATTSSMAGIYNEKLMKDRSEASVHFQNMQLYGWSFLFNVTVALAMSSPSALVDLRGFSPMTWLVIFVNAVMGLSM